MRTNIAAIVVSLAGVLTATGARAHPCEGPLKIRSVAGVTALPAPSRISWTMASAYDGRFRYPAPNMRLLRELAEPELKRLASLPRHRGVHESSWLFAELADALVTTLRGSQRFVAEARAANGFVELPAQRRAVVQALADEADERRRTNQTSIIWYHLFALRVASLMDHKISPATLALYRGELASHAAFVQFIASGVFRRETITRDSVLNDAVIRSWLEAIRTSDEAPSWPLAVTGIPARPDHNAFAGGPAFIVSIAPGLHHIDGIVEPYSTVEVGDHDIGHKTDTRMDQLRGEEADIWMAFRDALLGEAHRLPRDGRYEGLHLIFAALTHEYGFKRRLVAAIRGGRGEFPGAIRSTYQLMVEAFPFHEAVSPRGLFADDIPAEIHRSRTYGDFLQRALEDFILLGLATFHD